MVLKQSYKDRYFSFLQWYLYTNHYNLCVEHYLHLSFHIRDIYFLPIKIFVQIKPWNKKNRPCLDLVHSYIYCRPYLDLTRWVEVNAVPFFYFFMYDYYYLIFFRWCKRFKNDCCRLRLFAGTELSVLMNWQPWLTLTYRVKSFNRVPGQWLM